MQTRTQPTFPLPEKATFFLAGDMNCLTRLTCVSTRADAGAREEDDTDDEEIVRIAVVVCVESWV